MESSFMASPQSLSIEDFMATIEILRPAIDPILSDIYARKRGRPPFDPVCKLKAVLYRTRTQSLRQLCRELESNDRLLYRTGLPCALTHQSLSIFINRVGEMRLRRISELVVGELRKYWPDFGRVMSVDGTVVKAYAKRNHGFLSTTDADARLGYRQHTPTGKPDFEFGYRFTIASDAQHEIPITASITPANANESRLYPLILKQVKSLGIQFEIVIADAQYDSRRNIWTTIGLGAKPIIAMNPRASKSAKQTGTRRSDVLLPISRNSEEWKQYSAMRSASERVNSSLKELVGLQTLKVRRLHRVAAFFWICTIAKQLFALTAVRLQRDELARSVLVWCY